MADSQNPDDTDGYRFPWLVLATADFFFADRTETSCVFSRSIIKDFDLIDRSEVKKRVVQQTSSLNSYNERKVEDTAKSSELEPSSSTEDIGLYSTTTSVDSPLNTEVEELANVMEEMGLPTQFGRRSRRKQCNKNLNQVFLKNFEDYWEEVGSYLINLSWLEDYGHYSENQECSIKMKEDLLSSIPNGLLPVHKDFSKDFKGISVHENAPTWDDLFKRHSELVRERVQRDYDVFVEERISNRASNFISRMSKLGFVIEKTEKVDSQRSLELEQGSSLAVNVEPTDNQDKNLQTSSTKKICQENWFDDVKYNVRRRSVMIVFPDKTAVGHKVSASKCQDEKEDDGSDSNSSENSEKNGLQTIVEDKLNFDFGFDEQRDKHLIAKNAKTIFNGQSNSKFSKYWYQRFRLFSKLNEGILMDKEGWFSVTPERIAQHIADRMVRRNDTLVVDGFAGVGGNSIQLALRGAYVIAVDLDPIKLRCAAHNARIYGVSDRITFLCIDFFHFADNYVKKASSAIDAVFISPPWGGPSYLKSKVFSLNEITPNGFNIFDSAMKLSHNIAYFLPRQTNSKELILLASKIDGFCEIEQSTLNTKVKAITAYYGNLVAFEE